jgi:hypothetical protein
MVGLTRANFARVTPSARLGKDQIEAARTHWQKAMGTGSSPQTSTGGIAAPGSQSRQTRAHEQERHGFRRLHDLFDADRYGSINH